MPSHRVPCCGLDELIVSDEVGALALLRLLGLDAPDELLAARLAAGAWCRLRSDPGPRVLKVAGRLGQAGWTLGEREGRLVACSATGGPYHLAAALRLPLLWALVREIAGHLVGPDGAADVDLHGGGRGDLLDTELPEGIRRALLEGRAGATSALQLLPRLRSRLVLALHHGLELPEEDIVSALCPADPEGAHLEEPRRVGAQRRAIKSLYAVRERAHRVIEDQLNLADPALERLLARARGGPQGGWPAVVGPDRRCREREGRMGWLHGAVEGPLERRRPCTPESARDLWSRCATTPWSPPPGLEPLRDALSPAQAMLFALRYLSWRLRDDRPSLDTLAGVLVDVGVAGDARGAAVTTLTDARRALISHLDAGGSHPPDRGGRRPPVGAGDLLARWERVRSARRRRFEGQVARELATRRAAGRAPLGVAWADLLERPARRWWRGVSRTLSGGLSLQLSPSPALGGSDPVQVGAPLSLTVEAPVELATWRPVVVVQDAAGERLIHPRPGGRWWPLRALAGPRPPFHLHLSTAGPPGRHRYRVLLAPPGAALGPAEGDHRLGEWLAVGQAELLVEAPAPAAAREETR